MHWVAETSMPPGLGGNTNYLGLSQNLAKAISAPSSASKKGGKAGVIDGTRGPEIVYDANMFKSTALPPLGKGA